MGEQCSLVPVIEFAETMTQLSPTENKKDIKLLPIHEDKKKQPAKKRKYKQMQNSKSLLCELSKINNSLIKMTEASADISQQLIISNKIALFKLKKQFGAGVESELDL